MAWRVARDCEINFNGRGNVKSGDRLLRADGLPPQVPLLPQALAPVTLRVPHSPQPGIVCGGKQMCHLQAMEIQDLILERSMARHRGSVQATAIVGVRNHGHQESLLPFTPSVEEEREKCWSRTEACRRGEVLSLC